MWRHSHNDYFSQREKNAIWEVKKSKLLQKQTLNENYCYNTRQSNVNEAWGLGERSEYGSIRNQDFYLISLLLFVFDVHVHS